LKHSDLAIETALTLRFVFNLPLRQTGGFLNSLFEMMGIELTASDHTTLSRRSQHLDVSFVESRPTMASISSSIALGSRSSAKANGLRRSMEERASGAGRSSISVSIDQVQSWPKL